MQSTWPARDSLNIAIIMDGNGRWATRRGLPRSAGHRAGADAVRRVIEAAPELGIGTLTLFAFSSDNWRRPIDEVHGLMWLLRAFLRSETKRFIESGARLTVIGRRDRLTARLRNEIHRVERATAGGTKLHVRVALDYSARESIVRAAALLRPGLDASVENFDRILAESLSDSPVPGGIDLLIRSGGEKRLSDFLLWECAYAELIFSDRMWPDFDSEELRSAVEEFLLRERRFGGLGVKGAAVASAVAGR
jgi:undecaprenyl diphosphate synthase